MCKVKKFNKTNMRSRHKTVYQLALRKPGMLDLYISLRSSNLERPTLLLVLQTLPLIIHLLLKKVLEEIRGSLTKLM